jgi:threonine/homoserine/homoserine lactone efflux protein
VTTAVLTAFVLGLGAGMAPGPYTTMVAATGFERGFRAAIPLAAAPLFTDLVPLIVTSLILTQLNDSALSLIGILGGTMVIAIGGMLLWTHRPGHLPPEVHGAPPTVRLWHVVVSTSLSPAPWLFWLSVASPFFLRAWTQDRIEGGVFLVVLFATNIGSALSLAWVASHGGRVLDPVWRKVVLLGAGLGLVLAGGWILMLAIEGDFASITRGQDFMRAWVDSLTSGD